MPINITIIQGNLGADPEVKYTAQGTAYAKLSVAHTKTYKGKATTFWISIVAWGKLAETIAQYLKKGSQAVFQGELKGTSWEKNGVKMTGFEINPLDKFFFVNSPGGKAKSKEEDEDLPF